MHTAIPVAVLLAVECGQAYKIRHDPGLTVSENDQATGSREGIKYRIDARGINHCCGVDLDVLNVGPDSVNLVPYAAELTAEKCDVQSFSIVYIQGENVKTLAEVDEQVHHKSMATRSTDEPLWLEVRDRNQQFALRPSSFLNLSYLPRGLFRRECGAYSFKLRLSGTVTIAATFTEPS